MRKIILVFVLGLSVGGLGYWAVASRGTRELRERADALEHDLAASVRRAASARERANRLAANLVTATDALERANTRLTAIEDRQREIAELAESGASDLSRAIARGANIRDLLEQSIDIISELQNRIGSEDTRPP